ncbi:hypothetical protein ACIGQE_27470 [Streptomyces sp. NPDC053429]|uniref:hypothetical protein n=1 Tax=Streptomyces sp. NPDC053429 TaxID=3365702 RepID=UPI0037D0CC3D
MTSTCQYDTDAHSTNDGPKSIATGWPGLAGTNFTSKIDAACAVPGSSTDIHLFRGAYYVRYRTDTQQIVHGPALIASGWPGLIGTIFGLKIDAAWPVPGSSTDIYLFSAFAYTRYNVRDKMVTYPVTTITDNWPLLIGTPFSANLSAACAVPGSSSQVYLGRPVYGLHLVNGRWESHRWVISGLPNGLGVPWRDLPG